MHAIKKEEENNRVQLESRTLWRSVSSWTQPKEAKAKGGRGDGWRGIVWEKNCARKKKKKKELSAPPHANPAQNTSQTRVLVRPAAQGDIGCLDLIVDGLFGDGLEFLVLVSISLRSLSLAAALVGTRGFSWAVMAQGSGGAQAMSREGREGILPV